MPNQNTNADQTAEMIGLGIQGAISLLDLFTKLAGNLKQDAELSKEAEAELDASIADIPNQAFNKPEA